MSLSRQIAGNAATQIAGKFAGTVLGLVTVGIMTRHLGREGYGHFTTALSFLQFFGILVDFGLTLTMTAMISERGADEDRIASNVFTLRLVSAAVFFGLAPLVALAFPYPDSVRDAITLGTLSFLGIALSQVMIGIFQKHLAVHLATIAEVAGRLVLLIAVAAAAAANLGLVAVVAGLVLGNAVQLALSLAFSRSFIRIVPAFDLSLWRKIVSRSWPIGISIAFNLVYLKGDVVIMSVFRPASEIGLYGAAYKVLDVLTVVPMIVMGLALPPLAAAWSAGRTEDFGRKVGKTFDVLAILALPLAFGTFPVAADLMRFVAGDEFGASGAFLAVLMVACACVFMSALFGHAIVAMDLQRRMVWAYAADAAISLGLYLAFVPAYGAIAAAWVTVFSEAFIAAVTAIAVLRRTPRKPRLGTFARAAAAAAIMMMFVTIAAPLHVLVRIGLGAASYVFVLALIGGITPDVLAILRKTEENA